MLPGFSAGWDELSKKYRTDLGHQGEVTKGNTIQVGSGFFAPIHKNCTVAAATSAGLYLHPALSGVGTIPPVLIPWTEIRRVEPATLYWNPSARLVIGNPEVTPVVVSSELFGKIRQHLDPAVLQKAGC